MKSVVLTGRGPWRVARAVAHAREKKCHVITMSLGGGPGLVLGAAIWKAVRDDIIVMSAAGNRVKDAVFPTASESAAAIPI